MQGSATPSSHIHNAHFTSARYGNPTESMYPILQPPQPFNNLIVQGPTSGAVSSPLTSTRYGYSTGSMCPIPQPPQSFNLIMQDPTSGAVFTHTHDTHLTSVVHGYSTESLQFHPNFPINFNYASLAITQPQAYLAGIPSLAGNETRNMISRRSCVVTCPIPYPIGRSPHPRETAPGEYFAVPGTGQSVIHAVGQNTRESPGILAASNSHLLYSLKPALPALPANPRIMWLVCHNALSHQQQSKRYVPVSAWLNFKKALFTNTLLSDSTKMATMIQDTLFGATVQHLEGTSVTPFICFTTHSPS